MRKTGIFKDGESIRVKGMTPIILADLSLIANSVYEAFTENDFPEDEAKKLIFSAVKVGLKSKEEIKKEALESISELLGALAEAIGGNDNETEHDSEDSTSDPN